MNKQNVIKKKKNIILIIFLTKNSRENVHSISNNARMANHVLYKYD